MEKEKLISEFKKFLFENYAYARFIFNISDPNVIGDSGNYELFDNYLNEVNSTDYVRSAFLFKSSPEGGEYWLSINKKWLERLKSLEEKSVKPPIGLRPRFVDDIRRMDEIKKAVIRYVKDGWEVPPKWIDEYNELAERYPSH